MPVSLTAWLCVKLYTSVEHDLCPTCYERPPVLSDHFWWAEGVVAQDRFYCTIILLKSVCLSVFANCRSQKTSKTSGKSGRQHVCLFQWPATGIVASGAGRHGWAPTNSDNLYGATACARVHVHACVMCLQYTIIILDRS